MKKRTKKTTTAKRKLQKEFKKNYEYIKNSGGTFTYLVNDTKEIIHIEFWKTFERVQELLDVPYINRMAMLQKQAINIQQNTDLISGRKQPRKMDAIKYFKLLELLEQAVPLLEQGLTEFHGNLTTYRLCEVIEATEGNLSRYRLVQYKQQTLDEFLNNQFANKTLQTINNANKIFAQK